MPRSALFCETFLLNLLLRLYSAILICINIYTFIRGIFRINAGKKKEETWWSERIRRGLKECLNARVAQSVERSAVNRKVGGSNPPVSGFLLFFNISH